MSQPLIVTLRLDAASEKLLTSLRTHFFPTSINHLASHITLFHALPASHTFLYNQILTDTTTREAPFTLGLKSPFLLGKKGVAINVASFKLRTFHEELLRRLKEGGGELTEQDQRPLRPHVTVQNKVGEKEARRTMEVLSGEWEEKAGKAVGLVMWRYEVGGRWTFLREWEFEGTSS